MKLLVFCRAITHQLLVFDPNRPWELVGRSPTNASLMVGYQYM